MKVILNTLQYNFWSDPVPRGQIDLLVPPHKFNDFEEMVMKLAFKTELLIDNVQR